LDGTAWDANSKRITAVTSPSEPGDAATKNYVDTLALYGKAQTVPQTWEFTATAGQTNFGLSVESPEPVGTVEDMYLVTVDGVLYAPDEYTFSGGKGAISLVFDSGLQAGDKVLIRNFGVARAVADAITPGSITDVYLATDSVTPVKIAADAVTTVKINNLAVTETKIGAGAVTNAKLGLLAVQEGNISNGAVTKDKIGIGAVDTDQLATGAVTNTKIEDNTISVGKFATGVTVSTLAAPATDLAMNGKKITGLATPTAADDAATKDYVDTVGGGIPATGRDVLNFPIGTYLFVEGQSSTTVFTFGSLGVTPVLNVANNAANNVYSGGTLITLLWDIRLNTTAINPLHGEYRVYTGSAVANYTSLTGVWVMRGMGDQPNTGINRMGLAQRIA
jgi:hypothetical protein